MGAKCAGVPVGTRCQSRADRHQAYDVEKWSSLSHAGLIIEHARARADYLILRSDRRERMPQRRFDYGMRHSFIGSKRYFDFLQPKVQMHRVKKNSCTYGHNPLFPRDP